MNFEQVLFLGTSVSRVLINHVKPVPASFNRILVIKLDEIGDMLYTLHCLKALRLSHPESEIVVLCKSVNLPLLKMYPYANELTTEYPKGKFDLVVDLRGNWKTLWLTWIRSTSFYFDRGTVRMKNKFAKGQVHEVHTNWEIIAPVLKAETAFENPTLELSNDDFEKVDALRQKLGIDGKYVVFHCGAREEARRWPAEHFAKLADWVVERYQVSVLLVGAPNETELNNKVISMVKNSKTFDVSGQTSLPQLGALIDGCEFFVGNESGPLHFAVVLKKKLVALFGPGVKDVFYPLYPNQKVIHHFKDRNHTKQTLANSTIFEIGLDEVQEAVKVVVG